MSAQCIYGRPEQLKFNASQGSTVAQPAIGMVLG